MKKEYDFSNAKRGKFYKSDTKLNIPVYLDSDVQLFISKIAMAKRTDASSVVNEILKSDMQQAQTIR
jgi:hypothetical protein